MSNAQKPSKEQRILLTMRKVLASVVRETTPSPGMKHSLSESTREDIRMCFSLISARERELAEKSGIELNMRPRFTDEPATSSVVPIDTLRRTQTNKQSDNENNE